MTFRRDLKIERLESSAFLFGPRMTGKTTLLRNVRAHAFFDLLDPVLELRYRAHPQTFWEEISALPKKAVIVIDEVQRAPALLDYVQMGIDRREQIFLLSGSSARKLRRGQANLLGGRALDLELHPLTSWEIGSRFDLKQALQYGTLPKITTHLAKGQVDLARGLLASYVTTYLKEEIQAEALTRNLGAFQRFLSVAVQSNGQIIEFANISRDCAVAASTVKEYYSILEDTLLSFFLWPFDHCERKKRHPKSYFFDCGVVRALESRLHDPPTPRETGFLFEAWFINELRRVRDYSGKPHEFSYWRERDHEVDLLVQKGREILLAIECKSGSADPKQATVSLFRKRFPGVPLVVASMAETRIRKKEGIEILPWSEALERYRQL